MRQTSSQEDDKLSHPLHITLLSADGVLVPMEAYCSFVQNDDGSCSYLIGLKEDPDVPDSGVSAQAHPVEVPNVRLVAGGAIDEHSSALPF